MTWKLRSLVSQTMMKGSLLKKRTTPWKIPPRAATELEITHIIHHVLETILTEVQKTVLPRIYLANQRLEFNLWNSKLQKALLKDLTSLEWIEASIALRQSKERYLLNYSKLINLLKRLKIRGEFKLRD
jgi:hypothetical protein